MISLPQKGQPIDVSLMYKIVESINNIENKVSRSTNSTLSQTPSGGSQGQPQSVKTINTKIVTGITSVGSLSATATTASFSFPGNPFKYPPVVTITPIDSFVQVAITSVTISTVTFSIISPVTSTTSARLSIIAIGE